MNIHVLSENRSRLSVSEKKSADVIQSVSLDFALVASDVGKGNTFVWTVWYLTNEIVHTLAGTLICKFLSIPDWLKFRKGKVISYSLQPKTQ